jgi:hypothetical protein
MASIWHIGIAVPDLEKGKMELGEVFGLRWRPARVRKLTLADAAGRRSRHPQHTKLNAAMHPSGRTGVRFVLTNPSDPSRLDEFSDWYDTYSAAITVPGYLANDVHFENPDASGERNSPRYATIYDIVSPDPATAWPDTEHSPAYPAHLFSDPRATLVSPALRASYALVGSQLQPARSPASTTTSPTAATTPNASTGRPRSCRRACSTPPHDSGSSKDPPTPPAGSRYSRPTTPTPCTPTRERPATRRPHRRSSPS